MDGGGGYKDIYRTKRTTLRGNDVNSFVRKKLGKRKKKTLNFISLRVPHNRRRALGRGK
jgi:CRISPR/Cas system CSM-associated protein Csm5 (group 7 of RAMP superfamily)